MSGFKTALFAILSLAVAGSPAFADWQMNLPRGVSTTSGEVYDLHMLVLGVCVVIAAIVYGAMIYAIVNFRKTKAAEAAHFHHNTRAEVIWTVIPAAILVAMAVPSAETLIRIEDTRASGLTIKVTGYQWKWHYDYIDHGVSFFSTLDPDSNAARTLDSGVDPFTIDNYLLSVDQSVVVPVDTKVRLLVTGADVVHSWWVPALATKKDAVPGFINEAWFTATQIGVYRGQCAELCGMDHGFMPIVVDVRSQEDFESWLAERGQGAVTQAN